MRGNDHDHYMLSEKAEYKRAQHIWIPLVFSGTCICLKSTSSLKERALEEDRSRPALLPGVFSMSADIVACHASGRRDRWAETGNAAKHPGCTESPHPQQRIIQPNASVESAEEPALRPHLHSE